MKIVAGDKNGAVLQAGPEDAKESEFGWGKLRYIATPFDITYIAIDGEGEVIDRGEVGIPFGEGTSFQDSLDNLGEYIAKKAAGEEA